MEDLCVYCRQPLQKIEMGKEKLLFFTCINRGCPRVGLLSVVSVKLVEKKKEVEKNGIRAKDADKQNRKKG
jgi:hypothetical protein